MREILIIMAKLNGIRVKLEFYIVILILLGLLQERQVY